MLSSRQPPSPKNSVTTSSKYPAFALRYIPGSAAAGCFAGKAGLMLTGQQMLKLMMPTFYYILPRFSRFDGFDRHFGLLGQPEVAVLTGFDTHGRHVVRVAYPQMAAPLQIAPGEVFNALRFRHEPDSCADTDVLTICVASQTKVTGLGYLRRPLQTKRMARDLTWLGEAVITVHPKLSYRDLDDTNRLA